MADAFAFVAGGAVQAGSGLYLERSADRELLQHCLAGDFAYVLTSRQMGKSSLMYRAAERLADSSARAVIIDLTELGAQTTADQWYKGFLLLVQEQLGLREAASAWWDAHSNYAFAHRLIRYLREVALVERTERIVLFVDEIDTTLRLDFTDDFFAAIRFLYQSRAVDPELQRISFVLIGVATPNDLIKDAARTPFNIGHRIELTDFTRQEAAAIAAYLSLPAPLGGEVIGWTLRWTAGHPYLTMRVLRSLVESPPDTWTSSAIDARIHELFLGTSGERDTNLQFVRDMLTKKAFNREAVLVTYEQIRGGARVPDKELDQVASWLKLSGIVRRADGLLRVRNAIYEQVFDERWARVHRRLNVNWRRRLARAAAALLVMIVLVTIPLAIYALQQRSVALRQRAAAEDARLLAEENEKEAESRRDEAEQQLLTTQRNLQTAQEAVDALKAFDPKAAAQLSQQLNVASNAAETQARAFAEQRDGLRRERDEALALVQKLTQENAAQRQNANPSPAPAPPATKSDAVSDPSIPVSNAVGRGRGKADAGPGAPAQSEAEAVRALRDDLLQIERVLERYRDGYEALDARAIAAVYPAANIAGLQSALNQLSKLSYDLRVRLDDILVAPDGLTAKVTASETFRSTPKIGSAPAQSDTAVFTLQKAGGTWSIQSVKSNTRN